MTPAPKKASAPKPEVAPEPVPVAESAGDNISAAIDGSPQDVEHVAPAPPPGNHADAPDKPDATTVAQVEVV